MEVTVQSRDVLMPERMSESNLNEEESVDQANTTADDEVDIALRKTSSTGARLWDRVRSSLQRQKVWNRSGT